MDSQDTALGETASGDHGKPDHPDHPFKVAILYNGVKKEFEVKQSELISKLLAQAIEKFGPIPNSHLLALFNADGKELKDGETIESAAVKANDQLLLRPSAVKGGT